jgi:hypothetical protein
VNEKRRHPRVPLHVPIQYELADGTSAEGTATDLSMGGVFIEAESAPPFGAKAIIVIDLEGRGKPTRLEGIVRWGKPGGFGVQFGLMGARETHALATFIKRAEAQG